MIDKRLNFCFDILYRRTLTQSQSEEKKFESFTKPTTVAKAHKAQIYAVWKAVCSTSRVECSRQCGRQCRFYNTVESSVSPAGLSVVGSNQCQRRVQPPTMMQMLILYTYLYIKIKCCHIFILFYVSNFDQPGVIGEWRCALFYDFLCLDWGRRKHRRG